MSATRHAPLASAAATATVIAPTTRLRLTRRGRVVFTTLAALPLVFGAFALAGGVGTASASDRGPGQSFDYVTIAAGQSLWQVAEELDPTADPRDVIAEIVDLNRLASDAVQPGQRIALPAGLGQGAANIDG